MNKKFFKKIAYKTELAMVLIGQADFIEEEIVGFIKLTQAVVFENFGEIPLPTKFIFIAISPKHSYTHHELANCMATLFSDEVTSFCIKYVYFWILDFGYFPFSFIFYLARWQSF
jgi:hypothetical protein